MSRCLLTFGILLLLAATTRLLQGAELSSGGSSPGTSARPVTDPAQFGAHYRQVLSRPAYQEISGPDTTARVRDWLSRWFAQLGEDFRQFSYSQELPRFASLLMTVFVVLSLAGLFYTIIRLARRRNDRESPAVEGLPGETAIRPPEFYEGEIRRAIDAGDWHEAWLACWRQFLSRLEQGRLVESDRSRTNREYLNQLRAKPLPSAAESLLPGLVDAYDQFIYGRRPIGEREWGLFRDQINEAALMLHLGDATPGNREERGR